MARTVVNIPEQRKPEAPRKPLPESTSGPQKKLTSSKPEGFRLLENSKYRPAKPKALTQEAPRSAVPKATQQRGQRELAFGKLKDEAYDKRYTVGKTPVPQVHRSGGTPPNQSQATSGPSVGARMWSGTKSAGGVAKSNAGGVTAIFAIIAITVVVARIRGATINIVPAVLAWLLLFIICCALYKMNPMLGLGLSVLLLIQVILEFGTTAFATGIFSKDNKGASGQTIAPIASDTQVAGALGTIALGYAGAKGVGNGVASGVGKAAGGLLSKVAGKAKDLLGGAATVAEDGAAVAAVG